MCKSKSRHVHLSPSLISRTQSRCESRVWQFFVHRTWLSLPMSLCNISHSLGWSTETFSSACYGAIFVLLYLCNALQKFALGNKSPYEIATIVAANEAVAVLSLKLAIHTIFFCLFHGDVHEPVEASENAAVRHARV